MTRGLHRYYGRRDLHFITFSCYGRLPLLADPAARCLFVEELDRVRREYGFLLAGYVVMPNHAHLLMNEAEKTSPSMALNALKQRISRRIRASRWITSGPELVFSFAEGLPSFWQPRFYDFNVYTHDKKTEKLNYMHANPVVRGLVQHPKDWVWSSFGYYAKDQRGLISIDPVDF